ncbi:MAG: hypothetical protein OEY49_15720 [Candidatus Heimdallarchaeota archaeon]|nr:hypothetical protein [Candidatus Heimdallarchaeota archaeon]
MIDFNIINLIGSLIFILSLGSAVSMYHIANSIYFPTYTHKSRVEQMLYFIFGMISGANLFDNMSNIIIQTPGTNQIILIIPNPFKIYTLVGVILLILPYLILIYNIKQAKKVLENTNKLNAYMDPFAMPKLKLALFAIYMYLIGTLIAFIVNWLVYYKLILSLPYGLSIIIPAFPIFLLINFLYLSFQTPDWLRRRWIPIQKQNIEIDCHD